MNRLCGVIVMALATSMSLSSQATLISFQLYPTGSSNPDIASQFEVQLTDPGNHQALFMIHNNGPVQSTITDVLFYDGALLGIAALQDKDDTIGGLPGLSTVDFTKGAPFRPDRLPSYPAATFGADRDSRGGASNGIDSGEWLGVLFDLKTDPNLNFQDLLNGLASGEVSVGLHVQRIGETGGSDWYQSKTRRKRLVSIENSVFNDNSTSSGWWFDGSVSWHCLLWARWFATRVGSRIATGSRVVKQVG